MSANTGVQSQKSTGVRCQNANGVRVDCGCAPGGGVNASGCGACWPCAFDVTFSGLTWLDERSKGGYLWGLAPGTGPFRLHFADPPVDMGLICQYAHFLSNIPANLNCFTLTDSDGHVEYLPGRVQLTFGPLNNPVIALRAIVGGAIIDAFSGTAAGVPATITNELTSSSSVAISDNGVGAIAWGGTASLTAVGTCNSYLDTGFSTVNDSTSTIQYFGGQTIGPDSTSHGLVNLPAGDYTIFFEIDGLQYTGKSTVQINNGADGFVAVAQDPSTLAITEIGSLGFSSAEFDDNQTLISNETIQNADGITITHPGGYLGVKLKCADYSGNTTIGIDSTGRGTLPTFCVCISRPPGVVCAPCIEFGDGPLGPLPPGAINIAYSRNANGGDSTWFVSDSADGFNETVSAGYMSGGAFVKTADLGAAPGTTSVYGSIADVETANAGQNASYSISGGYISIDNATLPNQEKGVIWKAGNCVTAGNGPCDSSWDSSTVHLAATDSASCTTFVGDVDLVDLVGVDSADTQWTLTCANGDDGNAVWTLFASDADADNVVQWKKTGSASPLGTYTLDELVNPSSCMPDFSPVIS